MTIGERLQQYRKNLGLSQEELSQRLFVSRQTVSQWETDQTLPTVDNLIRIKEIFGVSLDALVDGQEPEQTAPEEAPSEIYRFVYAGSEIKSMYRCKMRRLHKLFLLLLLFGVLLSYILQIFTLIVKAPILLSVVILSFLLISYAAHYVPRRIAVKKALRDVALQEYLFRLYHDRLSVQATQNGAVVFSSVIPYTKMVRIRETALLMCITDEQNAEYFIRKADLQPDSKLLLMQHRLPSQMKDLSGKWRVLSIVSFVLSFVAYPVAALCSKVSIQNFGGLWKLVFFLPIPIASIVIGFILKSKRMRYLKNIVAGTIMTCVMATVACIPLLVKLLFWFRK